MNLFTKKDDTIAEAAKIIMEAKVKNVSLQDPVWDASFDRKTVKPNLTFNQIQDEVNKLVRGAKPVTDSFTVYDLKTGDHKELLYSAGMKGRIKIRVQLHPMKTALLKKDADSFGRIPK
jgi:hypothetical protein